MLKSVPILCRFKNLTVVLCVTLWYSNFSIYLKLTHIVTYGNILEYSKPLLAGHKREHRSFRNEAAIFFYSADEDILHPTFLAKNELFALLFRVFSLLFIPSWRE